VGRRLAVPGRRARGDGQALITRGAITRIADADGVSAPVVERDYVLTHIVQALAQLEPPTGLVFKGGTALRLCFYEDYRYSADLDFSLVGLSDSGAVAFLRRALERCAEAIGFPQLALPDADPLLIHYVGPLGGEREIKLDLADDELVLETGNNALIRRYSDQVEERSALSTYTLEEIAAEKLRCVIQRLLCRDISDLHRLFVREGVDVETVWLMFEQKTRARNLDPARFTERLSAREPQYRRRWERELSDLEPEVPPFEQVIRQLRRQLRDYL
jgi:predicted nucleotidyltransferase component of viral defense system